MSENDYAVNLLAVPFVAPVDFLPLVAALEVVAPAVAFPAVAPVPAI